MKKLVTAFLICISCAASADHCDKCKDYHRNYAKRAIKATCYMCGAWFKDSASMCWYPCEGRWLPSQYERCRKRYCPACSTPRWLEPQPRLYTTEDRLAEIRRSAKRRAAGLEQRLQTRTR